jgi:subtilisin family serine protease
VADEIVVIDTRAEVISTAEHLGFRLLEARQLAYLGLSALRLATPAHVNAQQAITLLRKSVPDLVADVNTVYSAYATQSAQVISLPAPDYAQRMIGWQAGDNCGNGFRIGMIDTAIEPGSPLIHADRLHQKSFVPAKVAEQSEHGGAVARLLVGGRESAGSRTDGLMPAAELYAANVFEKDGPGMRATAFAVAAALDWMVAEHVPVVNASLSGGPNALLEAAVRQAAQRGSVLVAAAGNDGPDALPAYPAAYPDAIAITAVDQDRQVFSEANRGSYIAFAAPGVSIWAADGKGAGAFVTGTSFAAPFATAASAVELMSGVPADSAALRGVLAGDAIHLGPPGRNPIYGFGLIHAKGACGNPLTAAQ